MIDVLNTPGGIDPLLELGIRKVPCVVVGDRHTFAQNLKDVAEFLGISLEREVLPPDRLVAKYLGILEAAERIVRQIPQERLSERVIPNRPRTIGSFACHLFRITDSFLLTCKGAGSAEPPNQDDAIQEFESVAEMAAYGAEVRARLAEWWNATEDRTCRRSVRTYYGMQKIQDVLERYTWHTAQHCRQLAEILERYGIKADRPPTPDLLAGLPLPQGLWE